jgi:hypothetical protein
MQTCTRHVSNSIISMFVLVVVECGSVLCVQACTHALLFMVSVCMCLVECVC